MTRLEAIACTSHSTWSSSFETILGSLRAGVRPVCVMRTPSRPSVDLQSTRGFCPHNAYLGHGVMMSMDMLQQMPENHANSMYKSRTDLHLSDQMEQYEACRKCSSYHHSEASGACCRTRVNRKWGPLPPPASRFLDDNLDDIKVRMTPAAERNHPFLRRTKGFLIDYNKQSNSTQYMFLTPDPVPGYPLPAPEPAVATPPLFVDIDYGDSITWVDPVYTVQPPLTSWVEPPTA